MNRKNYGFVNEIMQEESEILRSRGKNVYVIPEGGSTTLGIKGYISFVDELAKQTDLSKLEGILLAAGSGGTAAGILAGLAQKKNNVNVYAVNVLYSKNVIRKKIIQLAQAAVLEFKLKNEVRPERLTILDGYSEEGYKKITESKLKLISEFFKETGILLDPAYTGKAFCGYYENFIRRNRKSKVMFLHTGGIFGVFGRSKEYSSVI